MMLVGHILEPAGEPVEDRVIESQGAVFGRLSFVFSCLRAARKAALGTALLGHGAVLSFIA
jgi:hypothetical protein